MAETLPPHSAKALRLVNITRVVTDLNRSESFYCSALGFQTVARARTDPRLLEVLGLAHEVAEQTTLSLGKEEIVLTQFSGIGRPFPSDSRSNDLWFQHLAIVVGDMEAAYAHLSGCSDWQPISTEGPQSLPPSSGSVKAFKFRDPDGHPLELLWFPPMTGENKWDATSDTLFKGIDHSAISISATRQSLNFYQQLGFEITAQSFNHGNAQSRLDDIADVKLRVTGLHPARSDNGVGIEILEYKPSGRINDRSVPNDIATDWITADASGIPQNSYAIRRDPDGHIIVLKS
jgi:catechol 2,3-dioxygenase-like lactoylglutathione lyase family enzyme